MSALESVKELYNKILLISKEKYAIRKVSRFLRVISSIVFVIIMMDKKFNWNVDYTKIPFNLWDEEIRNYLNEYIIKVIFYCSIYEIVLTNVFRILLCRIDKSKNTRSIPVLFTLDDLVEFGSTIFLFGYVLNQLIERKYEIENNNECILLIICVYLFLVFVNWIYLKNCDNWYYITKEYTNFYDINGKRIPKDAYVIYYGKRYKVYWSVNTHDNQKNEWRIISRYSDGSDISLEEAAHNREGYLMLDSWKIGEADE